MADNSGTPGIRQGTYEARVCMHMLVYSYMRDFKDFKLERKIKEAGIFDDLIFDRGGKIF